MKPELPELSVLVIEDNAGDYLLVEDYLMEHVRAPRLRHATYFKDGRAYLDAEGPFDVILLDLSLPDVTREQLLEEIRRISLHTPVVILTGYPDIDYATKSLATGASDYLLKDTINDIILFKSVLYAIERHRFLKSLREHVSAIEDQNRRLREIAWTQSHVFRAPVARLMALVDLLRDESLPEAERNELLGYVRTSSDEIDAIIQNIVEKAQAIMDTDPDNIP